MWEKEKFARNHLMGWLVSHIINQLSYRRDQSLKRSSDLSNSGEFKR